MTPSKRQIGQLQKNLDKAGLGDKIVADSDAPNKVAFKHPKDPCADGDTDAKDKYSNVNPKGSANTLSHELGHQGNYRNTQNPGGKNKDDTHHDANKKDIMYWTTDNGGRIDIGWANAMHSLGQ
ncbi:MAG: hypothetical protein NTV93_19080 [Verrucomicrobia bacterium]|nr:hypothetical protein [Verrucomicrobiota bacterium]